MFRRPTVFVLGAGASVDSGFPTGEELATGVMNKADRLRQILEHLMNGPGALQFPDLIRPANPIIGTRVQDARKPWEDGITKCRLMHERLRRVRPPVIDYFLGKNPELADLGRFLIAWQIMEFEHREPEQLGWYRFPIAQLVSDCVHSSDLLKNKVHFVTFNYDISLDRALTLGLQSHSAFDPEHVHNFLRSRVTHLYGQIAQQYEGRGHLDFSVLDNLREDNRHKCIALLDIIFEGANGIKVIDPVDKGNPEAFDKAKVDLKNAEVVYILGYGFDDNNSARLGLGELFHERRRSNRRTAVLFTNYNDSNRINKKVSRLVAGDYSLFHPSASPFEGHPLEGPYFEKSTKGVYDALWTDFDPPESQ